jgi:uncharacterized membrane protein YhaH (DUF805 family)
MSFTDLYFSFDGRIGRQTFWLNGVLVIGLINAIGYILDLSLGADRSIFSLFSLITAWPNLAIQAKRWHDRGKSAWWLLINLVPIVGAFWTLVEVGFLKGTDGSNEYGLDPTKV